MNTYLKNIKRILILSLSSFLFLSSTTTNASECGILQLQNNRSSGVTVKGNDCSNPSAISSGSIFELSSKGRLWLKSNPTEASNSNFQLICQNKTKSSIQLEFSDTQSPWLNQSTLNNCSGWANNKLTCDGNNGEKKGLYCVLSIAKSTNKKSTQVERTTSVKMRSLISYVNTENPANDITKQEILATIIPELKLCKDLNQYTMDAEISWNVEPSTAKQNINIISTSGLSTASLSECVKTVVRTFSYPSFSGKTSFNSAF